MVLRSGHVDRKSQKRPSRFDRKYLFPDPDLDQRIAYCHYWQGKLSDNEDIDYPDKLCTAIARITDKFSFAYMQEAFIAALLAIAVSQDGSNPDLYSGPEADVTLGLQIATHTLRGDDPELDDLILWREIRKQIKMLRDEMDKDKTQY